MDVLLRSELLSRLGGRAAVDHALADGDWQRVMHGAYVAGDVEVDLQVRAVAARRLLPARSLVADRCLLWLLGVDVLPPGPPLLEVVVTRGAVARAGAVCRPGRPRCPSATASCSGRSPCSAPFKHAST